MARRSKPILPGLSRSAACTRSKTCGRLDGHRKACRPTLGRSMPAAAKAQVNRDDYVVKGVEVHSADRYEVQPISEPKARAARKGPKALPNCRVSKAGIRCDRLSGHKAHGLRHRFTGLVTILPEGESTRHVADTSNGQFRTARRPKAAPVGQREVRIGE